MNTGLAIAAALVLGVSCGHSILGERYILTRLFRRQDLPRLFGSDQFTRRTLRFAWHLTSVAWIGLGAIIAALAPDNPPDRTALLRIVAVTFGIHAVVTAIASRGRHLAWIVFLAIAGLTWLAP